METQNITLSIPKEVLLKAKLLAVRRRTSVSGLLTQALEEIVTEEDVYDNAHRRHRNLLQQSINLGTGGRIEWQREEIHER